ncbi:uroporphyrinogen-III synthase [Helicobacter enhydrae]|nr:uroporphyrinogen-III synthase [Helicobacter enhydrae]
MSREVIIVGYQAYDFAPSLVVGQIRIYDFCLDFSRFDSLIFTSKNAVLALEKNAKKYPQMDVWRQLPSYVIGRGTQKEVLACGGRVEYIAQNAHGAEFAQELCKILEGQRVCYLRAKITHSKLEEYLWQSRIDVSVQNAYESHPIALSQTQAPKEHSILLFTAPSAYKYFSQNFAWNTNYIAVALGQTTYQSFDSNIKAFCSPYQDIKKALGFCQTLRI